MTPGMTAACTGATLAKAEEYADSLSFAMNAYGIDTPIRQAMFLPNVGAETGGLESTVENLNYRTDALLQSFGRHRISEDDARRYGRIPGRQDANQEAIANRLYGGDWGAKNLGNARVGDGWRYRGRGLFQTTGRFNYQKLRDRLRARMPSLAVPDFEQVPDKLADPLWAALSAADYWDMRNLGARADAGNFDHVCDLLNMGKATERYGDSHGFAQRLALYRVARAALGLDG